MGVSCIIFLSDSTTDMHVFPSVVHCNNEQLMISTSADSFPPLGGKGLLVTRNEYITVLTVFAAV
jgi:hypothetical protein